MDIIDVRNLLLETSEAELRLTLFADAENAVLVGNQRGHVDAVTLGTTDGVGQRRVNLCRPQNGVLCCIGNSLGDDVVLVDACVENVGTQIDGLIVFLPIDHLAVGQFAAVETCIDRRGDEARIDQYEASQQ